MHRISETYFQSEHFPPSRYLRNIAMETRSVRFALEKDYDVYTVPSRHEFSYKEKSQMWLTQEEYKIMKYELRRIVDLMSRHGSRMSECTRGLECKTPNGSMNKKIASLDGMCAVLLEQERQGQDGIRDAKRIRGAYVEMNQVYVKAAAEQGLQDSRYDEEKATKRYEDKRSPLKRGRGRIQRLLFKGSRDSLDLVRQTQ